MLTTTRALEGKLAIVTGASRGGLASDMHSQALCVRYYSMAFNLTAPQVSVPPLRNSWQVKAAQS